MVTVDNHQLITVIRLVVKITPIGEKVLQIRRFHLVLHACMQDSLLEVSRIE